MTRRRRPSPASRWARRRTRPVGSGDQRPGHRHPLALTAGQLAGAAAARGRRDPAAPARRRPLASAACGVARPAAAAARCSPRPVSSGTSCPNWNTNPNAVRRSCDRGPGRPVGRCAGRRTSTSPQSGARMPARQCSRVDLPEPLGPITADDLALVDGRQARAAQRLGQAERLVQAHRRPGSGTSRTSGQCRQARDSVWSIQRRSASRWNSWKSASNASLCGRRVAPGRRQRLHGRQVLWPAARRGSASLTALTAAPRTTLVNSTDWRCGCGSSGSPSQVSRSVTLRRDRVPLAVGPAPGLDANDLDQAIPLRAGTACGRPGRTGSA